MVDRKVSVACKNPLCCELISPIKRRNNTNGRSEYCSRECYYEWSPGMSETYHKILALKGIKPNTNPREFMRNVLKEVLTKFSTWTARAAVLQIKRQTFVRWLKHFKIEGSLEKKRRK